MMENNKFEIDDKKVITDDEFLLIDLPVTKQTKENSEDVKQYFNKLKETLLNDNANNIVDKPLTTDIISRGYPISIKELETIDKINSYENTIKKANINASPLLNNNSKYYIIEDGRVFKCIDEYEYYGLNLNTMEWEENQEYMDLFYDTYFKFSELINFRDYYSIKKNEIEETRKK